MPNGWYDLISFQERSLLELSDPRCHVTVFLAIPSIRVLGCSRLAKVKQTMF